jgi:hypothetical protein
MKRIALIGATLALIGCASPQKKAAKNECYQHALKECENVLGHYGASRCIEIAYDACMAEKGY